MTFDDMHDDFAGIKINEAKENLLGEPKKEKRRENPFEEYEKPKYTGTIPKRKQESQFKRPEPLEFKSKQEKAPPHNSNNNVNRNAIWESYRRPENSFYRSFNEENVGGALLALSQVMLRQNIEPLPKFSGDFSSWPIFMAQYNATKQYFDDNGNMMRLRNSLTDKALTATRNQLAFSHDPETVIEKLKELFGRQDGVVRDVVNKMRRIFTPDDKDSASLLKFKRELEDGFSILINLQAQGYLNSPTIVDDILERCPREMRKSFGTFAYEKLKMKPGEAVLDDFMRWLKVYTKWITWDTDVRNKRPQTTASKDSAPRSKPFYVHEEIKEETSQPNNAKTEKKVEIKCPSCSRAGHSVADCKQFKDMPLNKRWELCKKKHLCFNCLSRSHRGGDCPKKKKCQEADCDKYHHKLLHKFAPEKEDKSSDDGFSGSIKDPKSSIHFKIIPVKLYGKDDMGSEISVECNAFLDDGSALTLIDHELAQVLNLKGPTEKLCMGWTDGRSRTVADSRKVTVGISGKQENTVFTLNRVRTVQNLHLPVPTIDLPKLQQKYVHLQNVKFHEPLKQKPRILIGEEHAYLLATLSIREGAKDAPMAVKTRVGWLIHGKEAENGKQDETSDYCGFLCDCKTDSELNELMNGYFSEEKLDPKKPKLESKENERALQILKKTLTFKDGRCEMGLLWKSDGINLPNSRPMAVRRLICLEQKMRKDPTYGKLLLSKMSENIDKGYLRKLSPGEAKARSPKTFYLPIFGVMNPHKPNKIRIVYDAAAKSSGVSLNDELLKGPDLLNSLCGILWRSREYSILVSGDIEEMYHRILLTKSDQDAQRILWRNGDSTKEPDEFVLTVKSFGCCDSPSSAEYAKNENAERFANRYPEAVAVIKKDHFVDNMLKSFQTEEEALKVSKDVKSIHTAGGFNMRGWVSNSATVMDALNGESSQQVTFSLNIDKEATEKILGLYWHVPTDTLYFKLNFVRVDREIINLRRIPTKREALKLIMSIYDPHGFAMPVVSRGRMLMQDMWRVGLDWDDQLTLELSEKWKLWMKEIEKIADIRIPRCFSPSIPVASYIELATFVDASEMAACAVSYLVVTSENGVDVAFAGAKCKVAPKHYLSVPRFELEACRLGARLANNICSELSVEINRRIFRTDSRTAFAWIRSDHRRYKPFVAARVSEILETTKVKEWGWIAGKANVADEGTKWNCPVDLSPESRWLRGPENLKEIMAEIEPDQIVETAEELRPVFMGIHTVSSNEKLNYMNFSKFSSWKRLITTLAWHFRFVKAVERIRKFKVNSMGLKKDELLEIKKSVSEGKTSRQDWIEAKWNCKMDRDTVCPLTPEELKEAETHIFRKVQWESYPDEVLALQAGGKIDSNSKLRKLSPYYDNVTGLIRMKGRVDAAPHVDEEFKRPIILERTHALTRLIASHYHQQFYHINHETVVNQMRQRFHISGLRVLIKSITSQCQKCKNSRATSHTPEMSPLPIERVHMFEKPFFYTGMDYFGPILVTVGRRHEKRWGVLFTCLVIRAVHIELASSLDTDSCILAIRNFMSRRGVVKTLYSDNGTNMRGAEAELRRAIQSLDKNRLQKEGQHPLPAQTVTEWKFITPRSPHHGGAWERMVRSIKTALYATLKERHPKEEILRNLLVEAENVVNSRPLTYQPIDPETMEALTPNHLLQLSGKVLYAPGEFDKEEYSKRKWRFSQQLVDEFWHRFVHGILPDMRQRTKWFEDQRPIAIDDIVILMDENAPRNCWIKGRVEELYPGDDGKVRSVSISTSMGKYKRPVTKLIILDVRKT